MEIRIEQIRQLKQLIEYALAQPQHEHFRQGAWTNKILTLKEELDKTVPNLKQVEELIYDQELYNFLSSLSYTYISLKAICTRGTTNCNYSAFIDNTTNQLLFIGIVKQKLINCHLENKPYVVMYWYENRYLWKLSPKDYIHYHVEIQENQIILVNTQNKNDIQNYGMITDKESMRKLKLFKLRNVIQNHSQIDSIYREKKLAI